MLTRTTLAIWALALLLAPGSSALAGAKPKKSKKPKVSSGLHQPVRLTAGGTNQMMGSLSPDGKALYLVSDRNSTSEIFVQDPVSSGPRLMFETNADAAQPQPSLDGKWLAYLSYKTDSTGDACVLELASGSRRCLTDSSSAELQLFWLDSGQHLAVLSRQGMHDDYQLLSFALGQESEKPKKAKVLLQRNLSGPAVTPDGRWLAYVPLVKVADQVGVAFSNRSAEKLQIARLGETQKPIDFNPDLPGTTGFPTFSLDGRTLYFSQYLNDTNGDGTIDGNDNSVLFRIDFNPSAKEPIKGFPEQLTSARWNCRYPKPAQDSLIMTCSHQGSLDIYSLPLTGAVPPDWQTDRLRGELKVARDHWTQLLLLGRLLTSSKAPADQLAVIKRMTVLHLEMREYESALFYCDQIRRLSLAGSAETGWADVVGLLAEHRRADVALAHGQLSEAYIAAEQARAEALSKVAVADHPQVKALVSIARSEILSDVGRKEEGLKSLLEVDLGSLREPLVVRLYAHRARQVYGLRADGEALVKLEQSLAAHPALSTLVRLHHAEVLVSDLVRGLAYDERLARVKLQLDQVAPDSEAGLMLRVYSLLLDLGKDKDQEQVRAQLFDIYKANKDGDRRRALVLATVRMASRLGNEYLQYQFATSWASWLKRSDPERKYAESLYRKVVLERAYEERSKGKIAQARGYFFATTMQTDSLEAHAGFIEAFLEEGKGDLDKLYQKRFKRQPEHPAAAYVDAYRLARDLPMNGKPELVLKQIDAALIPLGDAARTWPQSFEIHHLWGHLLHRRYLLSAGNGDAESAYRHYLLALDLARDAPRTRAAVEPAAALLQGRLGNHRLALQHLRQRERLPQVRPVAHLGFRLAYARSVFHVGQADLAVEQASQALLLLKSHPDLMRFRPLVLDRLALYELAAAMPKLALGHYRELIGLLGKGSTDLAWPVNGLKARLGLATAALTLKDWAGAKESLNQAQAFLKSAEPLRPVGSEKSADLREETRFDKADYEILLAGLKAQALRGSADLDGAATALQHRRDLLAQRLDDADVDEDLLEVARTDHHLAQLDYQRGRLAEAAKHLERGLAHSQEFNKRTGSGVNPVGLRLLQAYAEIYLAKPEGPAPRMLSQRLNQVYDFICRNPSATWAGERYLFGNYLTLLDLQQNKDKT